MDDLAVLLEKIGSLRAEITQLQELNDRYWLRGLASAKCANGYSPP